MIAIKILIIVLMLILFVILCSIILHDMIITRTPYVPSRKRAIKAVCDLVGSNVNGKFIDLGCGDGRVLIALRNNSKNLKLEGYEIGTFPYLISKFLTINKDINILYRNVLKADVSDATHIFCYLTPNLINELSQNILSQCKSGTYIYSLDFEIEYLKLEKKIELSKSHNTFSETLFVYKIL